MIKLEGTKPYDHAYAAAINILQHDIDSIQLGPLFGPVAQHARHDWH